MKRARRLLRHVSLSKQEQQAVLLRVASRSRTPRRVWYGARSRQCQTLASAHLLSDLYLFYGIVILEKDRQEYGIWCRNLKATAHFLSSHDSSWEPGPDLNTCILSRAAAQLCRIHAFILPDVAGNKLASLVCFSLLFPDQFSFSFIKQSFGPRQYFVYCSRKKPLRMGRRALTFEAFSLCFLFCWWHVKKLVTIMLVKCMWEGGSFNVFVFLS